MKPGGMLVVLALLAGWTSLAHAQSRNPAKDQPAASSASPATTTPVKAQLNVGKADAYTAVVLAGRKSNDIYYLLPNMNQAVGYATINVNKIVTARFEFQYDEHEVFKRSNERRWADAASLILNAIGPAIPYLDFPTNNAVAPALEAAGYLFKAGMAFQQADGETNTNNPPAEAAYAQAHKIFRQVGALPWFEGASTAQLKAIRCLAAMGKPDAAAEQFGTLPVYEETYDTNYGLYWLVQAHILYQQQSYYEALDAAVKSAVFQNKDMETFPDALLLSAHCYFAVQEMYRARDVYYEIVRLFDDTDWSAVARKQLAIIMKNNLTQKKEMANYWKTFIDVKDDMNKLVDECLAATGKTNVTSKTAAGKETVTNKTATATSKKGINAP